MGLLIEDIATLLDGKNVIIVGPSSNVLSDCSGIDVDSYDIVVRVNSHQEHLKKHKEMGKRTDISYHCMNPAFLTSCY